MSPACFPAKGCNCFAWKRRENYSHVITKTSDFFWSPFPVTVIKLAGSNYYGRFKGMPCLLCCTSRTNFPKIFSCAPAAPTFWVCGIIFVLLDVKEVPSRVKEISRLIECHGGVLSQQNSLSFPIQGITTINKLQDKNS